MQEMGLAFPIAHLSVDRAIGPRPRDDREGLVEPTIVNRGERILLQQ